MASFAFGEWRDLLEHAGVGRPAVVDADGHRLPVVTSDEKPWRAPRPAEPRDFAKLFGGSSAELISAGTLRLSSGRIVAADPEVFSGAQPAFTVTVDPGAYPIVLAGVRFAERPERLRVAAARLAVSDQPVVRWEMALQDGQSLLDLGAGEFYGFGVDSGQASFADADAWEALAERDLDGRDKWEDDWIEYGRIAAEQHFVVVDDGAMIAWPSGWGDGSYPVWIGYDSADRVACFVADMRL